MNENIGYLGVPENQKLWEQYPELFFFNTLIIVGYIIILLLCFKKSFSKEKICLFFKSIMFLSCIIQLVIISKAFMTQVYIMETFNNISGGQKLITRAQHLAEFVPDVFMKVGTCLGLTAIQLFIGGIIYLIILQKTTRKPRIQTLAND